MVAGREHLRCQPKHPMRSILPPRAEVIPESPNPALHKSTAPNATPSEKYCIRHYGGGKELSLALGPRFEELNLVRLLLACRIKSLSSRTVWERVFASPHPIMDIICSSWCRKWATGCPGWRLLTEIPQAFNVRLRCFLRHEPIITPNGSDNCLLIGGSRSRCWWSSGSSLKNGAFSLTRDAIHAK